MLLKGHEQMQLNMKENNMEFIMLFSTTKKFITEKAYGYHWKEIEDNGNLANFGYTFFA